MVAQVLECLAVRESDLVADMTLGGGGHSQALLACLGESGRLVGLDRDEDAVQAAGDRLSSDPRFTAVKAAFDEFGEALTRLGWPKADKVLMDLGVSSYQLDTADRGFSFQSEGPLDMRMDRQARLSAAELVNTTEEGRLADILFEYGEEKRSRAIARAIVAERRRQPISTTRHLADVVVSVLGRKGRIHPATRTFQALRIAVNSELEQLRDGLEQVVERLAPGGRLAVLSYHSLEDRIVKSFFSRAAGQCVCPREFPVCRCNPQERVRRLTRKPVVADAGEVRENPRARSAKLRVVEKL